MEAKKHRKHAALPRPGYGEWGRLEISLLGAPCGVVRSLAEKIAAHFRGRYRIGFADALHSAEDPGGSSFYYTYTDCISHHRLEEQDEPSLFRRREIFRSCDLVLVNGNHFSAVQQLVLVHPQKSLEGKPEKLTAVKALLLCEGVSGLPGYLQPFAAGPPVLSGSDDGAVMDFFEKLLAAAVPLLNGLVLTGGRSLRMGQDKSLLDYHGLPQQEHLYALLERHCSQVFLSRSNSQNNDLRLPAIEDRFLGLGPMAGILSAFQSAPDAAWLTVACDLPFLTGATLACLVQHRDPSRFATAFLDEDEQFPEPLITIWEPRAYPLLLQALAAGYSCPRKVLINSDIALLKAPDPRTLRNINDPESMRAALVELQTQSNPASGNA